MEEGLLDKGGLLDREEGLLDRKGSKDEGVFDKENEKEAIPDMEELEGS
eukprot:CAMPEP_0202970294 /NCGR_PEP_ID=MMETSP1396-20130829/16269_1 /ASSEMBLY_ACC=CAM_ASM_000872 /TAXON_ID= /ORGANISM="Pseudokeronopsis sp., Strain Brazil" /LENGTH=48 /DNA_ID= /DNA_START= /DNA_END= /DNA_ORIENTATION=